MGRFPRLPRKRSFMATMVLGATFVCLHRQYWISRFLSTSRNASEFSFTPLEEEYSSNTTTTTAAPFATTSTVDKNKIVARKIAESTISAEKSIHQLPKEAVAAAATNGGVFGICLTLLDDNMILPEWLAYHYTTLPLRYLVIAHDEQNSHTSPVEILNRFQEIGLQYWIWNDTAFLRGHDKRIKFLKERGYWNDSHTRLVARQERFIPRCNQFLKRQTNVTWVGHFDTDEFVVLNRIGKHVTERLDRMKRRKYKHDHAKMYSLKNHTVLQAVELRNASIPENAMDPTTSVFSVLENVRQHLRTENCVSMPRLTIGSSEKVQCPNLPAEVQNLPPYINVSRLETFRFVETAHPDNVLINAWGKAIVDVSQIGPHDKAASPHRPSRQHCLAANVTNIESILVLHHYMGSWERYNSRPVDSRRSYENWQYRGKISQADSCHSVIQAWLPKFAQQVGGWERAAYFLGHPITT